MPSRALATGRALRTAPGLATARGLASGRTRINHLTDSLVGYWTLNELSGARADATGRANHLTSNNSVGQAAGILGSAASFTAASSMYLSLADNADVSMAGTGFTVAAWVYLSSKPANDMHIVNKDAGTAPNREYHLRWKTGNDRFEFQGFNVAGSGWTALSTFGAPALSTWYFVVGWYSSTANTDNIQVNNGTVDSQAFTNGSIADTTIPFEIGRRNDNSRYWNGRIDEVGVWKRVLTAAERTALYNGGLGITYPFVGATV